MTYLWPPHEMKKYVGDDKNVSEVDRFTQFIGDDLKILLLSTLLYFEN